MNYEDLKSLRVDIADGVANVTIANRDDETPPERDINLFDVDLITELKGFLGIVVADDDVRVIVFQSGNPDFFIAHADVNLLLHRRTQPPALDDLNFNAKCSADRPFQQLCEAYRTLPKPTIAKIDGIARGGGLEFLASLDMRFCSPRTRLAQPELGLSFVAGGGAMTRWSRLIGTGRALELMLVCDDIDAVTAEKYGMVNRVMPTEGNPGLDEFVQRAALRIASFSPASVAHIKRIIHMEASIEETLIAGSCAFDRTIRDPVVEVRIRKFLDDGGQTASFELGRLIPDR